MERVLIRDVLDNLPVPKLAAAQFVFQVMETWPPMAVRWVRLLDGKLGCRLIATVRTCCCADCKRCGKRLQR